MINLKTLNIKKNRNLINTSSLILIALIILSIQAAISNSTIPHNVSEENSSLDSLMKDSFIQENSYENSDYYNDNYSEFPENFDPNMWTEIPENFDPTEWEEYNSLMSQIPDQDSAMAEVNEYFQNRWNPNQDEDEFIISNDTLSFEDSIKDTFFKDWVTDPVFPETDSSDKILEEYEAIVNDYDSVSETITREYVDDKEIITRTLSTGSVTYKEETTITGTMKITMEESFNTFIDDITIPILSEQEVIATTAETITVEFIDKIGINIELPKFDKKITLSIGIARIIAWAYFEAHFRFEFPVKLLIEYPKEVVEGGAYSLKVRLIPLDLPDYKEFILKFKFDVGFDIQIRWLKLYWVKRTFRFWRRRWTIYLPRWRWIWISVYGQQIDFDLDADSSYKTPLQGEIAVLDFENLDLDILDIIANNEPKENDTQVKTSASNLIINALNKYIGIGIGLDAMKIYGQSVTADLSVYAGSLKETRNVGWTHNNETKELPFRVPITSTIGEDNLQLKVSNLVFHSCKLEIETSLWIGLKDQKIFGIKIPLSKLGKLRFPLPSIPLPGFHLPSSFSYATTGISVASADLYDFTMNITEITPETGQGTISTIGTNDQLYRIDLQNMQGIFDVITLEAVDLPSGYSALFIGPDKVSISSETTSTYLLVSPSEYLIDPPGLHNFTIKATSNAKLDNNFENPDTLKEVTLSIPEINNYIFILDVDKYGENIIVDQDLTIPISFHGQNLGNVNDTIIVNATLYTDVENRTWQNNFAVDPYGSASNHFFDGIFDFTFAIGDLYPSPGLYRMDLQSTSLKTNIIDVQTLYLNFSTAYGLKIDISPTNTKIAANWVTNFTLTINNTGNTVENFTLESTSNPNILNEFILLPDVCQVNSLDTMDFIITLNIENASIFPIGNYDFRITAYSESGGSLIFDTCDVSVEIFSADETPPRVVFQTEDNFYYSDDPLVYPQTHLSLGPYFKAYDDYPGTYEAFINGSLYQSGSWINGEPVYVIITNTTNPLDVGYYNLTIAFSDNGTTPNVSYAQEWVTIIPEDVITPSIIPINNTLILPQNFADVQHLIWNCSEDNILYEVIIRNNEELPISDYFVEQEENETDIWRTKLKIEPGSLDVGEWNYTLALLDMNEHLSLSNITVIIVGDDIIDPELTQWPISTAYQGYGNSINITAIDINPTNYELSINNTIVTTGSWQSGTVIEFNADELSELQIGENSIAIRIYDIARNDEFYLWTLNYRDIDAPTLLNGLGDFTVYEHQNSVFNAPVWLMHDLNPGTYIIKRDGILVEEGDWRSGNNSIKVPIAGLSPGVYHFEAYFLDSSSNTFYADLTGTVLDVLVPYIASMESIQFEPLYTADWFEFNIMELHLASYELYRNDTLIGSGDFDFPVIFVNLENLDTGYHYYRLVVEDESGNIGERTVLIEVADYTRPLITRPADIICSEGTIGELIVWEIIESNPHNYSLFIDGSLNKTGILTEMNISLSLDGLSAGIHSFLLLVYDTQGLSHSCTSYVIVIDISAPFLTHIADYEFVAGDKNAKLSWVAYDLHPANYTIKLDGVILTQNPWDGSDINLILVGWTVGIYLVEITVNDESGNTAYDSLEITVKTSEDTSTIEKPTTASTSGFTLSILFAVIVVFGINILIRRRKI